jgi:hypothetical protein
MGGGGPGAEAAAVGGRAGGRAAHVGRSPASESGACPAAGHQPALPLADLTPGAGRGAGPGAARSPPTCLIPSSSAAFVPSSIQRVRVSMKFTMPEGGWEGG